MTKLLEQENGLEGLRVGDIRKEVQTRMREAEDADAETQKKVKVLGRRIAELEAKLPGERENLERMKLDCMKLQSDDRKGKLAVAAAEGEQLREKIKAGQIGVMEFHEKMAEYQKRKREGAIEIDKSIEETIEAVRDKAFSVLEMELELWSSKSELYYLMAYPSEVGLGELKKMIQELSSRSSTLATYYRNASAEMDKAKDKLNRAKGMAMTAGWSMDEIGIEQVKALPLLPEIPKQYLPSLFALISEIEAYEAKRIEAGQQGGLYFVRCSYYAGKEHPWDWMCRNSKSPIIQMSKTVEASSVPGIVTTNDLPKKTMEAQHG